MNDLPGTLDQITARLDALEHRVAALEHPAAHAAAPAAVPSIASAVHLVHPPLAHTTGALPILGRAMLGIAGAYLLRALEESDSLPRLVVASVALLYAVFWLVAALRVRDRGWPASTTYACTSALILVPMLWELTLRFNLFPAALTAVVLALYAVLASLLATSRSSVLAVAHVAVAAVAFALAIAVHAMLPFLAVLVLLIALGQFAVLRGRASGSRIFVAAAADAAVWALIYIYVSAPSTRPDYPALSPAVLLTPALALFALAGVATVLQTLVQRRQIAVADILQTTVAFLLAALAWRAFGPPSAEFLLGCICLVLAVAAYAALLARACSAAGPRTERVYEVWAVALLLAGGGLVLPVSVLAVLLSILAVGAVLLAPHRSDLLSDWHAVLFLAVAAVASGMPVYAFHTLASTPAGAPSWSIYLLVAAAALCYAAARTQSGSVRALAALRVLSALLVLASLAALAAGGLAALLALRWLPQAHHLAFIRTLTLCAATLALAYGGAHWHRAELSRMGYVVLALVAAKLLFEDIRHGHLVFLAASIFLFALTLIVVPRMTRPHAGAQNS